MGAGFVGEASNKSMQRLPSAERNYVVAGFCFALEFQRHSQILYIKRLHERQFSGYQRNVVDAFISKHGVSILLPVFSPLKDILQARTMLRTLTPELRAAFWTSPGSAYLVLSAIK